ncbi:MAG TPA: cytochrome c peroxidase [Kofleriaceae bacterium]|jgi:cytochrome c peroxidase|nr:cytochrome c peroxidase [Kofleriaceae bacterium]
MAVTLAITAGCDTADHSQPTHTSALAELGRHLFFDPALSADGKVACASCHQPEHAYADGLARASGVAGRQGTRNAPSLIDVARQRSLFWDGRRIRLEDQALDPLLNEVEHGLGSQPDLLARLHAAPYAAEFGEAFGGEARTGDPITVPRATEALAAFERTLMAMPSAFDRYRAGDTTAIPETARRGWVVFDQQAHCTRCHLAASGDGLLPLFTDHAFHSLSIGFDKVERKLPALTDRLRGLRGDGQPLGREVLLDRDLAELGRFAVTLDPRDLAAFKTPGLRNVARTAPYMHDGSVATLAEAVDLEVYSRGARDSRPLILTPAERSDLIAFLATLTSDVAGARAEDRSEHRGPATVSGSVTGR